MRACTLRHRVELQQRTETQDAYNQPVITWSKVTDLSANVQPLRGRERIQAAELGTAYSVKITMRFQQGLTINTDNRIVYDGRNFDINAVINVGERNRTLELHCTEVE